MVAEGDAWEPLWRATVAVASEQHPSREQHGGAVTISSCTASKTMSTAAASSCPIPASPVRAASARTMAPGCASVSRSGSQSSSAGSRPNLQPSVAAVAAAAAVAAGDAAEDLQ